MTLPSPPPSGLLSGLPDAAAMRLCRALLEAMARERGALSIDKPLARMLGLRRKELRRLIDRMVADGAALDWMSDGRKVLAPRKSHTVTLALTDDELSTLVFSLRQSAVQGASNADMRDATLVLADVLRQAGPMTRGLVLPNPIGRSSPPQFPLPQPGMTLATAEAVSAIGRAMEGWVKLRIHYTAQDQSRTLRVVWPLTTTNHGSTLAAWCELRQGFRHFRIDQIAAPHVTSDPIPALREAVLRDWRSETGFQTS